MGRPRTAAAPGGGESSEAGGGKGRGTQGGGTGAAAWAGAAAPWCLSASSALGAGPPGLALEKAWVEAAKRKLRLLEIYQQSVGDE